METTSGGRGGWPSLPRLPPLYSAVSFRPVSTHLHQQRQETAALRDLFISRAVEKRQERQLDLLRSPSKGTTTTTTYPRPKSRQQDNHANPYLDYAEPIRGYFHTRAVHSQPATANLDESDNYHHFLPAVIFPPEEPRSLHLPPPSTLLTSPKPKSSQRRVTSSSDRRGDVMSPSITRRGVVGRWDSFRALTQPLRQPLPQWMEGEARASTPRPASSRDLQAWQNEIVKVVPSRPDLVLPVIQGSGRSTLQGHGYPYKVLSLHPASHFYRSWFKITDKEYDIHPDWASERRMKSATPTV
ncbi:hypothetical protein ACOMHN_000008 [Nucella lapillus]